jgi:hypothetical protein
VQLPRRVRWLTMCTPGNHLEQALAMSFREFRDESGFKWEVWDVQPTSITLALAAANGGRQDIRDPIGPVQERFASGWLCFARGEEKRRLAPIPTGWHQLSETELLAMSREAAEVKPARAAGQG